MPLSPVILHKQNRNNIQDRRVSIICKHKTLTKDNNQHRRMCCVIPPCSIKVELAWLKQKPIHLLGTDMEKTMFLNKPGSLKMHEICTPDPPDKSSRSVFLLSLILQNTVNCFSEKCYHEAYHRECCRLNPDFCSTDTNPEKFPWPLLWKEMIY